MDGSNPLEQHAQRGCLQLQDLLSAGGTDRRCRGHEVSQFKENNFGNDEAQRPLWICQQRGESRAALQVGQHLPEPAGRGEGRGLCFGVHGPLGWDRAEETPQVSGHQLSPAGGSGSRCRH